MTHAFSDAGIRGRGQVSRRGDLRSPRWARIQEPVRFDRRISLDDVASACGAGARRATAGRPYMRCDAGETRLLRMPERLIEVDRARDLDLLSVQHFSEPNGSSLCAGPGGRSCGHPQGGHSCIWGQEPVKGRWRGGITVNDSIGQRSGAEMFRIEPTS